MGKVRYGCSHQEDVFDLERISLPKAEQCHCLGWWKVAMCMRINICLFDIFELLTQDKARSQSY